MKYLAVAALALQGAYAFPAVLTDAIERAAVEAASLEARAAGVGGCSTNAACNKQYNVPDSQVPYNANAPTAAQKISAARQNCGGQDRCLTFDENDQFVSTTGANAYASPSASQIRGPCPGLNVAANYGYLPRSGVPTILQTVTGLGSMYAMSPELGGFLAAYAVAIDGDVLTASWSIGGPPGALISNPQGISWSHNKYEGDTSIGRCDAYVNGGDAHSLSTVRFAYAYAAGLQGDSYNMDNFAREFTKNTFRSIAQNPNYFTGLFSTTLVAPAAYNFVSAFMSNHSADSIGGNLNGAQFKKWFAITGTYPNFKWIPGQEQIPTPWYRRPSTNPYTAQGGVFGDLAFNFAAYPNAFRFGGNLGKVNTYTGIDLGTFTGGVINAGNVLQGNNFQCLVYQAIQQGLPDVVNTNPLNNAAFKLLSPYLDKALGGVSCPTISKFNNNNLGKYPGRSYSPTAPANNRQNC